MSRVFLNLNSQAAFLFPGWRAPPRRAVDRNGRGLVDVPPLLTAVVSAYDARQAFDLAVPTRADA
ncbi:hypothetical protein CN311_00825 [Mesorhizobium sanjuanii]|uniref:Uncharacterized protein n=1 Tax=Mesorhizobium sanjuanii TaxID=2037900 RepID=A0A2A6FN08_9HYPH|nr:hypothetical protein CN311_00825 [Mesorhizobium sanjuanii]